MKESERREVSLHAAAAAIEQYNEKGNVYQTGETERYWRNISKRRKGGRREIATAEEMMEKKEVR